MFTPVVRTSKLNKSKYLITPSNLLKSLHTRTHFKAAVSTAMGDHCCTNMDDRVAFGDQFSDIAKNLSQVALNESRLRQQDVVGEVIPLGNKRNKSTVMIANREQLEPAGHNNTFSH